MIVVEKIAALDAALSSDSVYRVTSAYFGTCAGEPLGEIEISFVLRGKIQQRWNFDISGDPLRANTASRVVNAVRDALRAIENSVEDSANSS